MVKVYNKGANTNYKEKRLIKQLEIEIERRIQADASFAEKFKPASNLDELRALHNEYCVSDVEIISETKGTTTTSTETHINTNDDKDMADNTEETVKFDNQSEETVDPFNRANPKIRGYVLNDNMAPGAQNETKTGQNDFAEPTNFEDAFKLPDDFLPPKEKDKKKKEDAKQEDKPLNPDFDGMSKGPARKKCKRFATYIVKGVSALLEVGVPFWLTKDISDGELAVAAKRGEIDLSCLITLDGTQEYTVKEFFRYKCEHAKQIGKLDNQEDLIEDLTELLMEKGAAPTPLQSVLAGFGTELGKIGLQCLAFRSEIRAVKDIAKPDEPIREANDITNFIKTQPAATTTPAAETKTDEKVDDPDKDNGGSDTDEDDDDTKD